MKSKQTKSGSESTNIDSVTVSRNGPEGVSIMKKSKIKLSDSVSSALRPGPKESVGRSPGKRRAVVPSDDSQSMFDQTPASLSQISAIMAPEDRTAFSKVPSPRKKRREIDDSTMERAVQLARGEPDGADRSLMRTPKKKEKKLEVTNVTASPAPKVTGKGCKQENSTILAQKKVKCMKIPLKEAGKKLKTLKPGSKNKVSTKVKKGFDRTLPDETLVQKKPKQSWKEKKKERKMFRNNYDLIYTAKGLWEDLRRQNLPDAKRQELCRTLFSQVEGKVKELAVVHDSARIIQCLIKYGSPEYRSSILEEIKPFVAELSKNKYAKFIIRKLLKYGSKVERGTIIKCFHGTVRKLIRHKEAAEIVELAYNEYANAAQRAFLLEEFYGPAFAMFKTHTTHCLDDVLTVQPDKREMIMHNLKDNLLPLIDKQILALSIVHKIFFDFFNHADDKLRKDMTEALRESLIHMMHTKEGARVAMACIWGGSSKDRKLIVKSLKGHVRKLCNNEAGHMVLLAIFDCVDDTKLVQKVLLDEMLQDIGEMIHNVNGRKVLAYLLARRDQHFFCPDVKQILEQGDSNTTSKKNPEQRALELSHHVMEPLLTYLTEHATQLISNSHTALFVPLILAQASVIKCNIGPAMDSLAQAIVASSDPSQTQAAGGSKKMSLVEEPATHMTIKKILLHDKQLMLRGEDALFSLALINAADVNTYKVWVASNRGCFVLSQMLEVENAQVTQTLVTQLSPLKKYLKKMTFKGAEILLEKLHGEAGNKKSKRPLEITC